jgi:hypothetical protein
VPQQLSRGGGGLERLGRDCGDRLRLGQLALVEHVELLVDPRAGSKALVVIALASTEALDS